MRALLPVRVAAAVRQGISLLASITCKDQTFKGAERGAAHLGVVSCSAASLKAGKAASSQ